MEAVADQQRWRQSLPPGLAAMAPSPELLAALGRVDGARLGGDDPVTVALAWDRLRNAVEAGWLDATLEIGLLAPGPDQAPRRLAAVPPWGHHEVRAAFTVSAEVAQRRMAEAQALRSHHPGLRAAMCSGVLDPVRMRIFLRAFVGQRHETCAAVVAALLPEAPGLTPGELEARLSEVLIELDSDAADAAYTQAVARRRLIGLRNRDGSVDLVGQNLPVDQASAAVDRVDAIVAAAKNAGHPNMIRTLRADVALGLLDGRWEGFSDRQIITALVTPQQTDAESGDPDPGETELGEKEPDGGGAAERPRDDGPDEAPGVERPRDEGEPGDEDPNENGPGDDDPDENGPGDEDPDENGPGDQSPDGNGPGDEGPLPVWPRPLAGRARPRRELRIRLSTLLGHDRAPATLAATGIGTHPVPAGLALTMLTDLTATPHRWRLVLTTPDGHLDRATTTRARPTRARPTGGHGVPSSSRASATVVEIQIPPGLLGRLDPNDHSRWAPIIHAAHHLAARPEPPPPDPAQRRRRHPDTALTDRIRARDRTCAFPGCRAPALATETDHTRDWAHRGDTVEHNLAAFCTADHALKHLGTWNVRQPRPGVMAWTAPSGRTYTRALPPILRDVHDPLDQPAPPPAATDPDDADPVIDRPPPPRPTAPPSRYDDEPDF